MYLPQNENFETSYPLIYTLEDMLDILNLSTFFQIQHRFLKQLMFQGSMFKVCRR